MAESANKIYREKVEHTGTPFHIWLNAEKELYAKKKGLNADDNKNLFDVYLASRYRAGGKDLWSRNINKVMNIDGSTENVSEPVEQQETYNNARTINPPKPSDNATITEPVLPFLQRRAWGMPMPLTIGLTLLTVTAVIWGTVKMTKLIKNK